MDLRGLINSKSIVMVVAVLSAIVMNVVGRIEGDKTLEFIKWVVMSWVAAEAWENGKVKAAEKTAAASLIADPKVEDNTKALNELKKV